MTFYKDGLNECNRLICIMFDIKYFNSVIYLFSQVNACLFSQLKIILIQIKYFKNSNDEIFIALILKKIISTLILQIN